MPRRRTDEQGGGFPFEQYGFAIGGPLVSGMVDWMAQKMRTTPPQKILFLARDGQVVQEVWRRRVPADLAGIPTQYVLASRRALRMAAMRSLDAVALDFLTAMPFGLTPSDLLERVGIRPKAEKNAPASAHPWRCERLPPDKRAHAHAYLQRFEEPLLRQAQEERLAYTTYLREALPENPNPIALVDIGWHGSLQTALSELLPETSTPRLLNGYYLGLFAAAKGAPSSAGSRHGFLLDQGAPTGREKEIRRFVEILELFFSSPDPSLLHFRLDEHGCAQPVFSEMEHRPAQLHALGQIRAGILRFAETHTSPVTAPHAYREARRLGLFPTTTEAAAFGEFRLPRGFGKSPPLPDPKSAQMKPLASSTAFSPSPRKRRPSVSVRFTTPTDTEPSSFTPAWPAPPASAASA
ncbi:MAG: hypothetical protein JJT96_09540 [Opitutales bacterium]|nr:hypothetical protein [Opitutales bacterium]